VTAISFNQIDQAYRSDLPKRIEFPNQPSDKNAVPTRGQRTPPRRAPRQHPDPNDAPPQPTFASVKHSRRSPIPGRAARNPNPTETDTAPGRTDPRKQRISGLLPQRSPNCHGTTGQTRGKAPKYRRSKPRACKNPRARPNSVTVIPDQTIAHAIVPTRNFFR